MQLKPINEQVVVVMGASSGIGRQAALQFARAGARVVVSSRSAEGLGSLVGEIQRENGRAIAQVADVTDINQVRAVAERAMSEYGHLDTWVHAAAVSVYGLFEDLRPEEFRRVIDVNLNGQAHGAMVALPYLKREGRGALIHVSSVNAKRSFPLLSAYSASKHGIDGFLESLRVELMHEHVPISVTQVMPASINTPLFNHALTRLGVKPAPLPPVYEARTVAKVILYAAEHPSRDLVAGGAGKLLLALQKLSPRLTDLLLAAGGFDMQRTHEPKSEHAPNNLFAPMPHYTRVGGDVGQLSFTHSAYNWLETHPTVRRAALAGGLIAAGAVAMRRRIAA